MRLRPRCGSWLPLSTQQLRLRNLLRIEGINIKCDEAGALIYYTLHKSKDADAFYVSEYLPHRQEQKWTEIVCSNLFKSNDRSVCVKVWAKLITGLASTEHTTKASELERLSALTHELSNVHINCYKHISYQDKLLFTWGIYFSGLIPLSEKRDIRCLDNSLFFHINGEWFTSAEHVVRDISLKDKLIKTHNDYFEFSEINAFQEETECILPSRSISSYIHIPESRNAMSVRYMQLYFKSFDVRKSYNLQQLLKLQRVQRTQLQRRKDTEDLAIEIQQRSLYCITKEQLCNPQTTSLSSSFSRHQQRITMGRVLSELFSEQHQSNPHSLLRAQKLRKQLETLRLKHQLLQSECNTHSSRIAQQRNLLTSLIESRQQRQCWLRSKRQQLHAEKKMLSEQYQAESFLVQKRREIMRDMERRMSALCVGLREIYPIEKNSSGLNTINNVPFPTMDTFVNGTKNGNATISANNILPITLSVSLGYIAHLVQMIALIINRPLRNAIFHQGSRSRIIDIVKEIPYTCSEFPLYSRSSIPSKSVKYAIFLLNQNIAQLCYDITGLRCDMRSTLENIHHIFTYLSEIQSSDENKQNEHNKPFELKYNSYKNAGNGCVNIDNNLMSRSLSSVDIHHMPVPLATAMPENSLLQLPNGMPFSIEAGCICKQRTSRSVGSYSDSEEDFKDIHRHGYSNSDSNITMQLNDI
ncbi:UV radiation resistance-associated gene protein [Anastrepha obliqua]|uniref:UV radiation resistance-associated gene protein n=1 Tax=Anastrepha obliqua TaxID=95512 RepID=UPI002409C793|nr:UV radiation resistance-associated gene protein [Anastrepha obliqua]